MGKGKNKGYFFFLSERTLRKQLRDTTDGKQLVEKLGTPPLQGVGEIKEIIEIAEKGGCLDPGQLEKTERALAAMRRLKDYLGRGKAYENPLAYYEENLNIPEELGKKSAGRSGTAWWTTVLPGSWSGSGRVS